MSEPGVDEPGFPAAADHAADHGAPPRLRRAAGDATRRNGLEHLQFSFIVLTIALFVATFVVQAFHIPSGSMEDTLLAGDYLLVDKTRFGPAGPWAPLLPYRAIRRGDIIVFRYPEDPAQHFVKRVLGLPGDRIRLRHSQVYVNGRAIAEPYAVFKEHYPDDFRDNFPLGDWVHEQISPNWAGQLQWLVKDGEVIVPRDRYFVLGDNRDQSLDSRYWGFVPLQNVTGRPLLIYFSRVEAGEDDDPAASGPADDKLLTLRARICRVLGNLRWRRMLRLVP